MLGLGRRNPSLEVSFTPRIGKGDFFGFIVVAMNDANMPAVLNVGLRSFEDALGLFLHRFLPILWVDRLSFGRSIVRNTVESFSLVQTP